MGYMTTIGILNDRLDEIERNPEKFVKEISRSINFDENNYYVTGQTTVLQSHHADQAEVIYAGQNCWVSFGRSYKMTREQLEMHLSFAKRAQRILAIDKQNITAYLRTKLKEEGKTPEEITKALRKIK